jgi:hypothetical protein
MSVHLEEIARAHELLPRELLPQCQPPENFGMVQLSVRLLYDDDQVVLPEPELEDITHAVVAGQKTHGRQKRWSRGAVTLFHPEAGRFSTDAP